MFGDAFRLILSNHETFMCTWIAFFKCWRGGRTAWANFEAMVGRSTWLAYWSSLFGHGGPSLSAAQARALGDLDIDIDFDVYFSRGAVSRGSSVRERASSPPVSNRPPGPQEPGLDRARGSSLRRSFIPAFAIVRIDDVVGSGGQEQAVTVKKIVADLEEARSEVDRLNQIHSEKSCFYSWHNTKIEVEVLRRLGSSDA